jgi:hypothetical protein
MNLTSPPPGLPTTIWIVVRQSGEIDLMAREPLEGIDKWAHGLDAIVGKYTFEAVVDHAGPRRPRAVQLQKQGSNGSSK